MEKTKQSRYKEAREFLKELSSAAKALVKEGAFDTVNEAIIETCYTDNEHQVFKKFWQWKDEGKKIKKGSKGFPVWSKPIDVIEEHQEDTGEKERIWGICYIFSNAQVE